MEINEIGLKRLTNEEHFKFMFDTNSLIIAAGASSLSIVNEYDIFKKSFQNEDEALGFVRKSSITDIIFNADLKRDTTLRGLKTGLESNLSHFKPANSEAAKRLLVFLNNFGNVAAKSYEEESAAIFKIVSELKATHAADINTLGMMEWVEELESNNTTFDQLMTDRFDEADDKTRLRMKNVRKEIDKAYKAIAKRINALIIVNGEATYTDFVNKLNLRIDYYTKAKPGSKPDEDKDAKQ